jgi:hypothetical protein
LLYLCNIFKVNWEKSVFNTKNQSFAVIKCNLFSLALNLSSITLEASSTHNPMFPSFSKYLSLLFLLIIPLAFQACTEKNKAFPKKEGKIFPGFSFTKVIAYDYDGSDRGDLIIEKGKIHHSVKKQIELNSEQSKLLLEILNDSLSYGEDVTRCFKPHLGLIFFDEKDIPKAQISICFLCNQHNVFPLIAAQESVRNAHPKQFHGYSDSGRKKLIEFCQSLGFSNCSYNEFSDTDE